MKQILFEWDESKNISNKKKHNVDFGEARSVFFDDNALEFYDDTHSETEERYLLLGISGRLRILIVSYTVQILETKTIIRIISARKATKKEQEEYPGGKL